MFKPSTLNIPDQFVNHLREKITAATDKVSGRIAADGGDFHDTFKPAPIESFVGRLRMRPVIAGEVDNGCLDSLSLLYAEFGTFDMNDKNPQISCHLIGHVFWNVYMRRELVSIRFRFNLFSAHKTNAYVTYL